MVAASMAAQASQQNLILTELITQLRDFQISHTGTVHKIVFDRRAHSASGSAGRPRARHARSPVTRPRCAGAVHPMSGACGWAPPLRSAHQIKLQGAVHPMHPLVVPYTPFDAHPVVALPKSPAGTSCHNLIERTDHRGVMRRGPWNPVVRPPGQPHDTAGPLDRNPILPQ